MGDGVVTIRSQQIALVWVSTGPSPKTVRFLFKICFSCICNKGSNSDGVAEFLLITNKQCGEYLAQIRYTASDNPQQPFPFAAKSILKLSFPIGTELSKMILSFSSPGFVPESVLDRIWSSVRDHPPGGQWNSCLVGQLFSEEGPDPFLRSSN